MASSGIQEEHKTFLEAGNNPRKISPFFVPSTIINMISGHLSIRFGLRGPNFAVVVRAAPLPPMRWAWRCEPSSTAMRTS